MSLEKVLFDLENSSPKRNPEKYYLAVFGEPKVGQAWGWRFEGHHVSLNFTIAADSSVALTPSFLGANPGEIKDGPRAGLRALAEEEDLALSLVRSLTPEQQKAALVPGDAPAELLTNQERRVQPLAPAGIPASALNDALLQLRQAQNGQRDGVLINRHPLIDARSCNVKATGTDFRNCKTVSECGYGRNAHRLARSHGRSETCASGWLNTNNLHAWRQFFGCQGNSGNQTRTTDRHHDGIKVGNLLQNFQTNGALPCNNRRVVEAIDVRQTFISYQQIRAAACLGDVVAVIQNARAQFTTPPLLHQRGMRWHDHGHWNAKTLAVQSQRQRVIACTCCNHATSALFGTQKEQGVARPTLLEAAGTLLIFQFAKYLRASDC